MAVEEADKYQASIFVVEIFDGQICIKSPAFFIELAQATLSGWRFAKDAPCSKDLDVSISYQDDLFCVDASILDKPKQTQDLLDALNEFFLCLSYLLANKNPKLKLLHCASYVESGENVILLGEKNSGKSDKTLSIALGGDKIYADDLLLWSVKTSEFIALGLPLRLRRSTALFDKDDSIRDKFLMGKHILYSHKKYFNQAVLGEHFLLDKIQLMEKGFALNNIPIHKFQSQLEQFLISDKFISYKRKI